MLGIEKPDQNRGPNDEGLGPYEDDAEVYTCVKMDEGSGAGSGIRKWTI